MSTFRIQTSGEGRRICDVAKNAGVLWSRSPKHSTFRGDGMLKIVFLDRETLAPEVTVRRPSFPHEWVEYAKSTEDQAAERAADADVVVTNKTPLRAETLAVLPRLRFVAVAATGTDCVDKDFCAMRGVPVANIRGYAVDTVPEHVFALLLALARSLVPYRDDVAAGEWGRSEQFCFFNHPIRDLKGLRMGIVGAGSLGGRVAELARAFGMEPVFAGRKGDAISDKPGYASFDDVLATADVISLHCPLNEQTRNLIGAAEFRAMKRRPIIINTARGGVVDEIALGAALDEGLISGAGFDVAAVEPAPDDSPLIALSKRPNVVVTPHVAWASVDAQQRLADQLIDNIENFFAGKPTNLVVGG